ncbi:hypothetical protein P5673_010759 [Acropora cervicornis]|uniref:DEAD/DEAH box helicase domain-containing protein n=1 Tax=Acropora cervicornis TaxID=6130 RepID=A0AAD9QR85_ACRCE|nr:hypothetical protein P5673_010759 [Acropora cervicornis]
MADTLSFDAALAEALSFLSELGMSRVIRPEQKEAIYSLVHGSDLLAVLLTGFGKSLIFQLLIRVKQILSSNAASTKKGNKSVAFRESCGNLGELRSFCKQGNVNHFYWTFIEFRGHK